MGFKSRQDRRAGITHDDDEHRDSTQTNGETTTNGTTTQHRLTNFRDVAGQEHKSDIPPEDLPMGWRAVLNCSEDDIKYQEAWPANKAKEQAKGQDKPSTANGKTNDQSNKPSADQSQEEHDLRRKNGEKHTHNDAYGAAEESNTKKKDDLSNRYSPQEIALLRALEHESAYRQSLRENDGKRPSPQREHKGLTSIDEKDQFTPDNWLPRSSTLVRLTGSHPLNAEAKLSELFDAGLITPNELHYVRNHGAVPRLLWGTHKLDVENGALVLSMDDMKSRFESVNIAVSLACDGNRRKEVNMIKQSKGFGWSAGGTGCAYWKGALLRDVLLAAGVSENQHMTHDGRTRWVNFEGCDEPSEGKYATSIPLKYAMDPSNDVLLAYEMNEKSLPPDHGYPLRLIIPGYVGGRCIKWLGRVWTSDDENSSHYHIWDNRVLPSFITDKDGPFAKAMFAHPDTACNEQNLNSVIVKPAQGEKLRLNDDIQKGRTYRIQGYAYDGGGHEVQRVEVSLDGGATWLYCIRELPDYPVRHGNKFWTWLHWHVDVSVLHLLQAKDIHVRAFNVFKNTQPRTLSWNIMGMMNNCWYRVKTELVEDDEDSGLSVMFRHPCDPSGDGGWMKPSVENQFKTVKQKASTPQKQFTREEIEKHDTEKDCWLVVDNAVYDATSVLDWHPGGKAAILGHAGKVHKQTSDEFASVHDGYAYQKLQECALGVVTEKTANFIKADAEARAKEAAKNASKDQSIVLQKHRWVAVTLDKRSELSKDTRQYTFRLPDHAKTLGLGTCQHIQMGFHFKDKMLIRSYTPTRPLLPPPSNQSNGTTTNEAAALEDDESTFDLVVKTYFPSDKVPGGAMSNLLDCMRVGDQVDIRGPTGEILYLGDGLFDIESEKRTFSKVSLVLGGSGLTPGFALIARVVASGDKAVEVRVVDANKSEADILLHDELDRLEKESQGRLKVTHVLSHPSEGWKGIKGHVDERIIKDSLFAPGEESVAFLCGPPTMIQKAALPALRGMSFPLLSGISDVVKRMLTWML